MQFTGLHDKNGKEVYEGDIVEFTATDTGNKKQYTVIYEDGCYTPFLYHMPKYIEVIGNIYENPELLK